MALVSIQDEYLERIGNAIRLKNGLSTTYRPKEMGIAIANLGDYLQDQTSVSYMKILNNPAVGSDVPTIHTGDCARYPYTYQSQYYFAGPAITQVTHPKLYSEATGERTFTTAIEDNAFKYQYQLTRVDLPATVISIAPYAFEDCPSLDSIWIRNTDGPGIYDNGIWMCPGTTALVGGGRSSFPRKIYVYESVYDDWYEWLTSGEVDGTPVADGQITANNIDLYLFKIEDYPDPRPL